MLRVSGAFSVSCCRFQLVRFHEVSLDWFPWIIVFKFCFVFSQFCVYARQTCLIFCSFIKDCVYYPFAFGSFHSRCDRIIRPPSWIQQRRNHSGQRWICRELCSADMRRSCPLPVSLLRTWPLRWRTYHRICLCSTRIHQQIPAVTHSMSRVLTTLPVMLVSLLNAGLFWLNVRLFFLSSPRCMRETPLGSPLYSHFSRGERLNGEPLLGRHGLLAVAVTSSSRRRWSRFSIVLFSVARLRVFSQRSIRAEGQSLILPLSFVLWLLRVSGMSPRWSHVFWRGSTWISRRRSMRVVRRLNWISSSSWVFAWTGASSNGGGFEVPFQDHWRPWHQP